MKERPFASDTSCPCQHQERAVLRHHRNVWQRQEAPFLGAETHTQLLILTQAGSTKQPNSLSFVDVYATATDKMMIKTFF
jgi:hypothetical protein